MGVVHMQDVVAESEEFVNNNAGRPINIQDLPTLDIERLIQENWERLENQGRFDGTGRIRLGDYAGIAGAWKGRDCYVVGGSISGRGFDLKLLNGKYTIGVNHMLEYYHGFTWFVFQDHRFLRLVKYDLKKYKGKMFAHNTTPIEKKDYNNLIYFKSFHDKRPLSLDINYGLYSRSLTGMCAVHLALISGAEKVYLIGMDCPLNLNVTNGLHYDINYTGEEISEDGYKSILQKMSMFKKFIPYKDKIINIYKGGYLDTLGFKSIDIKDMPI